MWLIELWTLCQNRYLLPEVILTKFYSQDCSGLSPLEFDPTTFQFNPHEKPIKGSSHANCQYSWKKIGETSPAEN